MSAPALAPLAAAIDREHQAAQRAARSAVEHALECGRLLIEAKAHVGHGGWLPWVDANLSFGDRQARKYMRVAQHADQIGLLNSDLSIDQALAAIAAPKDEPAAPAAEVPLDEYLAIPRPLEPGEIEIPIVEIVFRRNLYPRSSVQPDLIERYREFLADLPPIEVNQRNELIDGLHRLEAHKKAGAETIRAVITEVADDLTHLKLACLRNARHGEQLPIEQEREARRQSDQSWPHPHQRMPATLAEFLVRRMREIDPRIKLGATGLDLPDDLTFEQWLAIGRVLPGAPELAP